VWTCVNIHGDGELTTCTGTTQTFFYEINGLVLSVPLKSLQTLTPSGYSRNFFIDIFAQDEPADETSDAAGWHDAPVVR